MKSFSFFPLERNRYYYGKLLTVRDFEIEQDYASNKRRLLNRVVHGAGVVCGLGVTAGDDATLMIESGLALDYLGREVVIDEPLVRKLPMLDGYDQLKDKTDAYLCLAYAEEDTEPVNAVGAEVTASRRFNMTREGFRLFLTGEAPEYRSLLEAQGQSNVNIVYAGEEATLILCCPPAVCAGEEFTVSALIVKNEKTPPVHFAIEGESAFVESPNGRILLEYHQSAGETRNVVYVSWKLKTQALSRITSPLFPAGAELNLELGSHRYKNYITVEAPVYLCADREELHSYRRRYDGLARHLSGGEIPIYLAKLELIHSTGGVFLSSITGLPFGQTLQEDSKAVSEGRDRLEVTTTVKALEYWQKPDVKAFYSPESETMHFDFGIPSPEQYDYSVCHGTVDLTMSGGIRVNARYFSEEFPHGLGAGAVDVRLSIEFPDGEESAALLVGNSEVFKSKAITAAPPWAEVAAILYPEKGTMKVGVWLHDNVNGNRLRIHYFAQRPERDTSRILTQRKLSISVLPEVARLQRREQLRLKATVVGSEDKGVLWSVKEADGGAIDANGIYQAPEVQGTYEIIAAASADPKTTVSAFVIVE